MPIDPSSRIAKNTIWNLTGVIAPLLAGAVAMPLLIHRLGTERFGALGLVWALLSYGGLLDFGLSQSLTKLLAERSTNNPGQVPAVICTGYSVLLTVGILGGAVLAVIGRLYIHHGLHTSAELQKQSLTGVYLIAASIPSILGTSGIRAIMEGKHRFDLSNSIRLPANIFTFLGPLAASYFTTNLAILIAVLTFGRYTAWIASIYLAYRQIPDFSIVHRLHLGIVRELLRFAGWVGFSNLFGQIFFTLDRLLLGALVSLSAVTYFTPPVELATRVLLVPASICGVFFPSLTAEFLRDRAKSHALFDRAGRSIFLLLFPATVLLVSCARPFLRIWLGNSFASHSFIVLQYLAVGVFYYGIGYAPQSALQAAGRPDITPKLYLTQIVPYTLALLGVIRLGSIAGVALVWAGLALTTCIALYCMAQRLNLCTRSDMQRMFILAAAALVCFVLLIIPVKPAIHWTNMALVLIAFTPIGYLYILEPAERALLHQYIGKKARQSSQDGPEEITNTTAPTGNSL